MAATAATAALAPAPAPGAFVLLLRLFLVVALAVPLATIVLVVAVAAILVVAVAAAVGAVGAAVIPAVAVALVGVVLVATAIAVALVVLAALMAIAPVAPAITLIVVTAVSLGVPAAILVLLMLVARLVGPPLWCVLAFVLVLAFLGIFITGSIPAIHTFHHLGVSAHNDIPFALHARNFSRHLLDLVCQITPNGKVVGKVIATKGHEVPFQLGCFIWVCQAAGGTFHGVPVEFLPAIVVCDDITIEVFFALIPIHHVTKLHILGFIAVADGH